MYPPCPPGELGGKGPFLTSPSPANALIVPPRSGGIAATSGSAGGPLSGHRVAGAAKAPQGKRGRKSYPHHLPAAMLRPG